MRGQGMTAALAAATIGAGASGQVVYVDDDAPRGGDGSGWGSAFRDIHDALASLVGGDGDAEIRIAQGVYKPDRGTGDIDAAYEVTAPRVQSGFTLSIRGGFAGLGATDPDAFDPGAFTTVLSADLAGDDAPGFVNREDNARRLIRTEYFWPSTFGRFRFEGLVLRAGNAARLGGGWDGEGGAVLWKDDGELLAVDCVFEDNQALRGGAIYSEYYARVGLLRCRFVGNRSLDEGGAVRGSQYGEPLDMVSCRFERNFAYDGGAVWVGSIGTIANCLFAGNEAVGVGGAIREYYGRNGTIAHCTIVGNRAGSIGGAAKDGRTSVVNSIFWGNADADGSGYDAQLYDPWYRDSVSYSCVQGATGDPTVFGFDPLFTDELGPDGVAGTGEEDYTLKWVSACISLGSPSEVPGDVLDADGDGDTSEPLPIDLAGAARVQGDAPDAGAFETDRTGPDLYLGFTPLGAATGEWFFSTPTAISADGSTIVGLAQDAGSQLRLVHLRDGVVTELPAPAFHSVETVEAVSGDGSVAVGRVAFGSTAKAVAWRDGVPETLDPQVGTEWWATDVSDDGRVICGTMLLYPNLTRPVRWIDGEMEELPLFGPAYRFGEASAASGDGSVIAGYGKRDYPPYGISDQGVYWDTREHLLSPGLEGLRVAQATATNLDGSVIVGIANDVPAGIRDVAVLVRDGSVQSIGGTGVAGDVFAPRGMSIDGTVVVGNSGSLGAWIWDAEHGMRSIRTVLERQLGFQLAGWELGQVTGITADGQVLVGAGTNPHRQFEGWQARIVRACSAADVTTLGSSIPGVPDGRVSAADLQVFVEWWRERDGRADLTTPNAGEGDDGYGVPDGRVTAVDLSYFVNAWLEGCE